MSPPSAFPSISPREAVASTETGLASTNADDRVNRFGFLVSDLSDADSLVGRVVSLGGSLVQSRQLAPGVVEVIVADPDGNVISLSVVGRRRLSDWRWRPGFELGRLEGLRNGKVQVKHRQRSGQAARTSIR